MAEASRPVYPEDTTFVISPPSCHPSQNSYRKSELKLLKTFCHTCKSQCEGIDVLKHLFFGIIQCKGCFEIRACNQFTRYFPMTTKCLANKDGHVLVWKELPVGYVMQHTRAEMTKKSTSVLATQEVADVASRYVQTLLSLRELEPWKAAISHMIKEPLSLKISDLPPPLQPCRITRGRTSEEEKVPPAKRRALYRTPAVPKTRTKPDGKETSVASQSPSNSLMEFVPSPYSRTLYHEVTTPVISQPSCHPSQNSYRKAQLKLLKTFCYTCKSQCEGIDVLKHLFFGIIQCKCHFDIRACCQFTQYFPMTTKCPANKDGHVLVWKELPVGYVMQHTRAEMAKKSTSVPTSEEVADVASHYVRTLMSLRELEPWKAAISYMVKNPVLLKISDLPPPMQLCRVTMGQTSEKVPPAKRRGILQAPAVAVMKAGAEGTKPRTRHSSCAAIRAFRNSGIKSIKAETPPFQTTFAPKSQSSSASLPTIPGEVTVFSAKTNTHTAPDRTHATPVKTSTHTSPAKTRTTPAKTSTHFPCQEPLYPCQDKHTHFPCQDTHYSCQDKHTHFPCQEPLYPCQDKHTHFPCQDTHYSCQDKHTHFPCQDTHYSCQDKHTHFPCQEPLYPCQDKHTHFPCQDIHYPCQDKHTHFP
ncbi:uncharacterized protein LOC123500635 [Portunus trituberculatus]|uniref:uncharacterized protein LOC123500635 n=1 Tax=Portunus trituberculatus TaxID=210409 RepID=UPI001E1CE382|nr:uncharacterized protein LOC123500635 [Portunus trituberculatus]XP_045105242.1 uncharacterized protein LOC123500635 [Portunus trituberculatus]XP_045105247.1 uncharacterized protein LOC123500635 [Portunus trituberculatus]